MTGPLVLSALLLALFSLLWTEGALVYGAVGFSLLAVGASLNQAEFKFPDAVAVYGGIGFGLYLFGRVLESLSSRLKSLSVWLTPLTHWSVALTGAAVRAGSTDCRWAIRLRRAGRAARSPRCCGPGVTC